MKTGQSIITAFGSVIALSIATLGMLNLAGVIDLNTQKQLDVSFRNYDGTFLWQTKVPTKRMVTYEGPTPSKPETNEISYVFSNWDKPLGPILEDTIFYPEFFEELKQYKVTFQNYDSKVLYIDYVSYSNPAEYFGPRPARPSDDEWIYTFSSWDKPLNNIVADTVITALYSRVNVNYHVTYRNYNNEILFVDRVTHGTDSEYLGIEPFRPSNKTTDYVFIGWDKNLSDVMMDIDTTALFEERPILYAVTFLSYDQSTLYIDYVSEGARAHYLGEVPRRPADAGYVFSFSGWNKSLETIKFDLSVVAVFTKQTRQYQVTFYNYDDSVLSSLSIDYGEKAIYDGVEPIRPPDHQYTYEFVGWDRNLSNIKQDLETYPVYRKELRVFDVIFQNYDNQFLALERVTYGNQAHYFGTTPIRNDDPSVVYKFIGWDKPLDFITENTKTIAVYEISLVAGGGGGERYYPVFYLNYDGKLLDGDLVDIYESAVYYGLDMPLPPQRPLTSGPPPRTYTFISWDREEDLLSVEELIVTFAQYETNLGEKIVTYRNTNGDLLYEDFVMPGNHSLYGGPAYAFLLPENGFLGWSKPLENITESMTVYPLYAKGTTA